MSLSDHPLTAIERARLAYELMMRRQRDAATQRRLRERSRIVRLVIVLAAMVTTLVGTAIYNGWVPTSLRSSALAFRTEDGGRFNETRTGQIRSFVKGNTCQELQFNNERGVYVGGNLVPCELEVKREKPPPSKGGLNSIRDAFSAR